MRATRVYVGIFRVYTYVRLLQRDANPPNIATRTARNISRVWALCIVYCIVLSLVILSILCCHHIASYKHTRNQMLILVRQNRG